MSLTLCFDLDPARTDRKQTFESTMTADTQWSWT